MLVWSLGLLATACAYAADDSGASIYTCVDAAGRRINSDRPIAACVDREQRELGPSGTVRRIIGPTLTQHEQAKQAAISRKAQNERDRAAEARRRQRMLVTRYPNQDAHEAERAATLETVDVQIKLTQHRELDLQQKRKILNQEMEFYQRDPSKAPAKLKRELADNDTELDEQRRNVITQTQEKRRINQRFDQELLQLRTLWDARQMVPGLTPGIEAPLR